MTTAKMVADYMESRKTMSGKVQMLKLLYYAQAWSLAWTGRPLFDDRIEAWEQGPVVVDVYFNRSPKGPELTEVERATVDAVLAHYGKFYGNKLSQMTHDEEPWQKAWAARPDVGSDWGQEEISLRDMRKAYTRQSMAGEGPKRPRLETRKLSDGEVLTGARRNAERWAGTLALLAQ